jgi:hypothetical protein
MEPTMPPTAVAAFVKKWFDVAGPPKAEEPRLVCMRPEQYRTMLLEWQTTLETHVPSALEQGEETLSAVLYMLNITLRVADRKDSIEEAVE